MQQDIEHPENEACYEALAVNKGIEQPDPVNPAIAERLKHLKKKVLSADEYITGILDGNINILSQAITLVESARIDHQAMAQEVINRCLPNTGKSIRVGITGVPGAGKSTFIEAFGKFLTNEGHKIAVLAIDPSSERSKGSILGDKTRMEELACDPHAYIRPSPSAGSLGGVARKTREAMLLCEAAGFDIILIETVGVGQSETAVHSMVDFFLLVQIAGAGDELQGIKRGIMELADILVVTKDDGDNRQRAAAHCQELKMVLHYLQSPTPGWTPSVLTCSSLEGRGLDTIEETLFRFRDSMKESGFWYSRRRSQSLSWVQSLVHEALLTAFEQHPAVASRMPILENMVAGDKMDPVSAAHDLLSHFTYPAPGH